MHTTTRIIPAVVLSAVLVACGSDAPSPAEVTTPVVPTPSPSATQPPTDAGSPTADGTPGATTPDGWQRILVADQGFSLAIPDDWEQLSPDVIGDSGVMEDMLEANPEAAAAIQQGQAAIASGEIAFFAFDASDESVQSGFATNINAINVGPVQGTAEDAARDVAAAITQQIPVLGEVETTTVSLPAGDAALVRYEWEITDGEASSVAVTVHQYAIIAGATETGFILSMSAASDVVDRYDDVFRQIAESFVEVPE